MEKGFPGVGMREITARAGLTPTQSYRLGLAKEDLLAEISIRLTDAILRSNTVKSSPNPGESLQDFVERYLLKLYKFDVQNIAIRRESAAYGWMWSDKYESRVIVQVLALLMPITKAMESHGLNNIAARGLCIWSLYYVGFRRAVVGGGTARQCLESIRESLSLALV